MSANGTSLKSDVVEFTPNVPVQLSIKYPQPKIVAGRYGERAMFSLVDGRVMFLDLPVAEKVVAAAVRIGEPFWMCKTWDGKRTSSPVWSVWLDNGAEKVRAAEEHPGYKVPAAPPDGCGYGPPAAQPLPATELEWQLRKSIEVEQLKRKLGVDSPAAASLDTPWAAAIRQRTQANLEIYWDLCQWAQSRFPGMTKREVSSFLMNALISGDRGGKR